MSLSIEKQIELLLAGHPLEIDGKYETNRAVQNEIIGTKGTANNYVPICQKTVTYIVAAVIINNQEEVLMIQEAKSSCHGKWYLPAGRVDPNETLLDAIKREVLEETGLIFQPETLILVECASGSWFRFVFNGKITAGNLKTLEQANEESLQASWVHNINDLPLRSHDIVSLIERGKSYAMNKDISQHPYLTPVSRPLNKLLLRLTITSKKRATNKLHVLVSDTTPYCLPVCEINPNRSLLSTLHSFMEELFGNEVAQHKPHGILSVEFSGGQGGDGLCLTILVSFKLPVEDVLAIGKYVWYELPENLATSITYRLPRNMTVPLNVIR
ncbi:8-oxo-dGDP phosphatase NUDT18 [Osmia bicornis bicornis]|uniref:8-oxo-dGDP phosphatase NUDT18 n=1 Tax=Osmia bicornis bicornis TaxID=1437191 RepID=UPI0010F88550|nr:8-oxo-dGDP phosphatase NUDT18 [Osmia bicornis bicornis]